MAGNITLVLASLGRVAHELLTVSIRNSDTAELLQDYLQRLFWDVLEPLTQISQRELELCWHTV